MKFQQINPITGVILFYFLVQVCGLFIGFSFIESQISVIENPEKIENSFEIFFIFFLQL